VWRDILPWYNESKPHATLAVLLQLIESYIMIDVVCRRIANEKPDLPVFTIHDSLVTTVGNEEYIRYVMEEEILRMVGFKPSLKIEYKINPEKDMENGKSMTG